MNQTLRVEIDISSPHKDTMMDIRMNNNINISISETVILLNMIIRKAIIIRQRELCSMIQWVKINNLREDIMSKISLRLIIEHINLN